jgi:transposase
MSTSTLASRSLFDSVHVSTYFGLTPESWTPFLGCPMGKYSDQKKLAAAADYCKGHLGLRAVARRHGVNVASLRLWAAAYRVHGARGVRTKQRKFYSAQFKLSVLQRIRNEDLSHRQAAALFNVRNRDMIGVWQRAYEVGGMAALYPHSSIRRTTMTKQANVESGAEEPSDETRTREELLEELHQLRMENAYLKKLKALAQEDSQSAHDKGPKSCKS